MKNKQIWGRIGQIVLVLLGISFVTFALVMLSPGDPVRQMIAGNEDIVVSQVEIDALRHELGLDKPFIFQYLDWYGNNPQNGSGYSNPAYDALSDKLAVEFDPAKRRQLVIDMQKIILDDAATIIFGYPQTNMISNTSIANAEILPCDYYWLTKEIKPAQK